MQFEAYFEGLEVKVTDLSSHSRLTQRIFFGTPRILKLAQSFQLNESIFPGTTLMTSTFTPPLNDRRRCYSVILLILGGRRKADDNPVYLGQRGERYVSTVTNMLGQTTETTSPALSGTSAATVTQTKHYEPGTGRLLWISSDTANTPNIVMKYNSIGVLTRRGQSQNTTLDEMSDDRMVDLDTGFEIDGNNHLWSVQRTSVYPDLNLDNSIEVSTRRDKLAGFSGYTVTRTETTNIEGEVSFQQSLIFLSAGGVPDGPASTESRAASQTSAFDTSYFGRRVFRRIPGVTEVVIFTSDDLGRRLTVRDPRHSSASQTVYKSNSSMSSNQIEKTIDANGDTTLFTYHGQGSLGAGQVSIKELPDNSKVYSTYDERGRIVATWGSQTYTRWYKYNGYNEMTELRTWQNDPGLTLANVSNGLPPGSVKTTWTYDDGSGLVLTKRDADSLGFDYQYDTAGRLSRRTDARTIKTDYTYTVWGELDTVTYTDDPEETRPLDYNYDRLGRLDDVT